MATVDRNCITDATGLFTGYVGTTQRDGSYPAMVSVEADDGTLLPDDARAYAWMILRAAYEADRLNRLPTLELHAHEVECGDLYHDSPVVDVTEQDTRSDGHIVTIITEAASYMHHRLAMVEVQRP